MIFTLTDRSYNPLATYETTDYSINHYIKSIIKSLDLRILTVPEEAGLWQAGSYIMCADPDGHKYWFTIFDVEDSLNSGERSIKAYSGTIDIVGEDANPIEPPPVEKPFEWYFDKIFYDTGITLGTNEIANLTRTLEFTSVVSNAEMLQFVLNGFDGAEADLAVEFDGSVPTGITLHVFKRIGKSEPQVVFSDEDNTLISLNRTNTISELATALYPEGVNEDNSEEPLTLVGRTFEEKDESGKVVYYSPENSPRIYSVKGKENYFVELPGKNNGEHDGYINRRYSSQADSRNKLWREGLKQLKAIDHAKIGYTIKGFQPCNIGDQVQIVSNELKPPVTIEARILEHKANYDIQELNEYTFGNFLEIGSQMSEFESLLNGLKIEINKVGSNASKKIEQVKQQLVKDIEVVLQTADGKNSIYDSNIEPRNMKKGDLWFKPNGPEEELWQYVSIDGVLQWKLIISTADIAKIEKEIEKIIAENALREKEFRDRMDLTDKEIAAFEDKLLGLDFELDNIVIDSISPEVVMQAIKNAGFSQSVEDIRNKVNSTSDSLNTTIELVGNNGKQTYNKNRTALTELLIPFGVDKKTIAHNGEGFEVGQPYTVSFAARLIERGNSRVIFDFEVLP